jgi:small subunit ribosomal protein S1
VAAEYQEAFGEHAYDEQGNYIGEFANVDFTPETEAQAAWAEYAAEIGGAAAATADAGSGADAAPAEAPETAPPAE